MDLFQKTLAISLIFILSSQKLAAQSFIQEQDFLNDAKLRYQAWLDDTELAGILKVEDLLISDTLVILDLRMTDRDKWLRIKKQYEKKYGTDLRRKLFNKMIFLLEVQRKEGGIRIHGANHFVDMRYFKDQLLIYEKSSKSPRNDSLYINYNEIPSGCNVLGAQDIETIKDKLKNHFQQYYQNRNSSFFQRKVKTEIFAEEPGFMTFTIWNIKHEILDSGAYFERILLDFTFKRHSKGVKVFYEIYGTYGSGIFLAPRKSEYQDIDLQFDKTYMDDYKRKLANKINMSLRKQP